MSRPFKACRNVFRHLLAATLHQNNFFWGVLTSVKFGRAYAFWAEFSVIFDKFSLIFRISCGSKQRPKSAFLIVSQNFDPEIRPNVPGKLSLKYLMCGNLSILIILNSANWESPLLSVDPYYQIGCYLHNIPIKTLIDQFLV